MARVDYDKQCERYDQGRGMTSEGLAVWMATARRHTSSAETILDLGSGTGRFSAALADTFAARVIGVEPSAGMRSKAATKPHSRVHVAAGAAEAIPVGADTFDLAWLSNVIHHFDDIPAAARELRRTVKAAGTVLVRGAFAGRDVPSLYRYFPSTQAVIDDLFPTVAEVIGIFEDVGFASFLTESVTQKLAPSMTVMVERMRLRADTTLEKISDEEFERGLEMMRAAALEDDDPVIDVLDLLVIR